MQAQLGIRNLIGHRLLDRDGNSVGKIGQVFFDDQTDVPKWVTVRSGLFGTRENFVPLRGAQAVDDGLQVPYTKAMIKQAPSFQVNQHISMRQEDVVYRHYGLDPAVPDPRASESGWKPQGKHARRPDAGPSADYHGGEAACRGFPEPPRAGETACHSYPEPPRAGVPQRRGYQQTPNVRRVSYPGYDPGPQGGDAA